MPSLWEVLKTSKGLPAPDGFTALFARSLSDTYTLAEISGIPPLNLGEIVEIVDYTIYGNTYQAEGVSPDNPQEVVGSGDRTANLFSFYTTEQQGTLPNAISCNKGESRFYITKSVTDNDIVRKLSTNITLTAGTYTVSIKGLIQYTSNLDRMYLQTSSGTNIALNTTSNSPKTFTLTEETTISLMYCVMHAKTVYDNTEICVMLNTGETALPYEPYGYKIPVVTRGKNLFDRSTTEKGYSLGADGSLFREAGYEASDFIKVEPNMIVSRNKNFTITTPLCEYTKDKVFIQRITSGKTVALSSNTQYIRIAITESMLDVILNTGTTPEPYEPYTPPITTPLYLDSPLYKIGDYSDSRGMTEEVRVVKELVLTGEENTTLHNISTGNLFRVSLPVNRILDNFYGNGVCSHYTPVLYTGERVNGTISGARSATLQDTVDIVDDYSTIDDFKSYLAAQYAAGTPVKVYYVLATPETKTVNAVEIPTLNGTTLIDVDTEVKPSNMWVEYKSSISEYNPMDLRTTDNQVLYTADNEILQTKE